MNKEVKMSEIFNQLRKQVSVKANSSIVQKDTKDKLPTIKFNKFIPQTHLGKTPKNFVMCEGWFLRSMYEDLRQLPDNNYVTCMDSLVYDEDFDYDGLDRTKVSCIVKRADSRTHYDISSEAVASRVANLFGIQAQYVVPVGNGLDKCICVDFLSGKQTMDNYYEFTDTIYLSAFTYEKGVSPIRMWVENLERALKDKLAHLPADSRQVVSDRVLKGFIKQYLFKKYIMADSDPAGVNYSFVYEQEDMSDLHISPLYDMQFAFNKDKFHSQFYGLNDDIQYLANMYGTYLKQIINEFGSPDFEKIKSIVYDLTPYASKREYRLSTIKTGFKQLLSSYKEVKSSIQIRESRYEFSELKM